MTANYCRTSTTTQNTDRQITGDKLYEDKCSGSVPFADRRAGGKLLMDAKHGRITCVRVHEISRLGRSVVDVVQTLETFAEMGVQVLAEKEGLKLLDDSQKISPVSRMMINLLASIAQFERELINERIREGVAIAKAKGKYQGRAGGTKESSDKFLKKNKSIVKYLELGESLRKTALLTQKSKSTVIKVRKALRTKEAEKLTQVV